MQQLQCHRGGGVASAKICTVGKLLIFFSKVQNLLAPFSGNLGAKMKLSASIISSQKFPAIRK